MAKEADELVIPVSKYPHSLALPVLVPRATLPPQSAIWSIIILISLNCISEGLEKRKTFFLSRSLGYAVSLPAPQRAIQGEATWPLPTPPHLPALLCPPSFPSSSCPSFLIPYFPPTRLIHLKWNLQRTLKWSLYFSFWLLFTVKPDYPQHYSLCYGTFLWPVTAHLTE